MKLTERYSGILDYFQKNVPVAQSELSFSNPFELIVAVMLSAQCTYKRVNLTTPDLFRRFPTVEKLSQASVEDVLELIKSISYPNSKATHLVAMAGKVMSDFEGEIPTDVDSLMTLPGVGRKTANVVASIIAQAPVIAVDTHVFRVAHRTGLSNAPTPEKVEADLERHIPEELRPIAHHWLILHGRYTCTARSPKCSECPISSYCKYYKSTEK